MICLDTGAVIVAINRRVPNVRPRLEAALVARAAVAIPVVVLHELSYGIRRSARGQAGAQALAASLALGITVWSFEPEDAEEAGEIRRAHERAGTPIGAYGILIAAQARRRSALLVTANTGEFARLPGLKMENWALD
ncbi:MAG TPA: PIN domain-containing protein [Rhizomicrobium sp.]|jgi:tRNA(fMet)-specific endonuclease VapC|nr:PIN domain-containing protein [Rhizomicrobium sp.]